MLPKLCNKRGTRSCTMDCRSRDMETRDACIKRLRETLQVAGLTLVQINSLASFASYDSNVQRSFLQCLLGAVMTAKGATANAAD